MAKAVKSAVKVFVVTFLVATGLAFALGTVGMTGAFLFGVSTTTIAAMSALSTLVGGLMSKGTNATAENFGSKVATRTATAPRQIIYGKARVGGAITHIETSGTDNYKLSMIVVLAGHEVESLEKVLVNDIELTTTSSGGFEYATNSKFTNSENENKFTVSNSLLRYKFKDGSQTTADSNITGATSLGSTDKFIGMAYMLIEFVFDSEAFGGGIPPLSFVVKGKKVYDPRSGQTAFTDSTGKEIGSNPALCVRDYLTDTTYGLKATSSEINDTTTLGGFASAANTCETAAGAITTATVNGAISSSTTVTVDTSSTLTLIDIGQTVTGTGITGTVTVIKRTGLVVTLSSAVTIADGVTLTFNEGSYIANGITNMTADGAGVIEGLLSSCAGKMSYINGKFVMFAGASVTPEMTITDDNLLAPISITTKQASGETYNTVKAVYVDGNNNYVATDSPTETTVNPATSVTFLSEDTPLGESQANYRKNLEIQLPFTDSTTLAQRLQRTAILHSRQEVALSALCNISYMQLQPFDWVYLTNERLGYTNKVFEVLSTNLEVMEQNDVPMLATRLDLKEIDSSVYGFASSSYTSPIDEGSSVSTGSFSVTAPTNLSLTVDLQLDSTTSKVNIDASWTNNPDDLIQGTEILYGTSSGTYIGSVLVGKGKTKAVIPNLMSNSNYYVVARHFSSNNVFSPNTGQQTVNTGLPSAPSAPTNLSATSGKALVIGLQWTAPSNSDLRAVKVYRHTSNFTPTNDTYLVSTITSEPSQIQKLTFGLEDGLTAGTTYHFAVRAINHSGTHSTFSSVETGSFTLVDAGDIDLPDFSGYFHKEGSTTTALTSSQFNTEYGRTPLNDDILIMVNTSATPKVSKAYKWNGSAFVEINNFTTGDLVVDGTLAGDKIIAQTISADRVDTDFITTLNLLTTSATITNNIVVGTGNNVFKAETGVGIQLGHATFSSAPFSVTEGGLLKAESGTIGGINLANNKLYVGTGTVNNSNTAFYLDSSGNFSLKDKLYWNGTTLVLDGEINATTGAIGGFEIGTTSIIDDADSFGLSSAVTAGDDVRFFAGDTLANKNIAPFKVTESGALTALSATITGALTLTNVDGTTVTYTGGDLAVGSIGGTNINASSISTSKILAHATSLINPVTATGNVYRYGGYNDIGTVVNAIPSGIALSYNSTEDALSIVSDFNTSISSDSFEIDHNSIYKISFQIKKTTTGGNWYVGAKQFTSFTSGNSIDGGNNATSIDFGVYGSDRTAGTDTTNPYFAIRSNIADTNYSEVVAYLIGSEVNIDEVPNHSYSASVSGFPYIRLNSTATHAGIRILNWNNDTTTRTVLVKNITMAQMTANTIVAENISTTNLSAISSDLGSITAGSLNINSVFTVSPAGVVVASSGTVGGFTLGQTSLTAGTGATRVSLSTADGIHLGNNTFSSAPFRVTRAGALTATNATITGNITATSGSFAGSLNSASGTFTGALSGGTISIGSGNNIFKADTNGIYLGNTSYASALFKVSPAGVVQSDKRITSGTGTTQATLSGEDTTYRFWSGGTSGSTADFSVSKTGEIIAKKISIYNNEGGLIFSSDAGFSDLALTQISAVTGTPVQSVSDTFSANGDTSASWQSITLVANTNLSVSVALNTLFGGDGFSNTSSAVATANALAEIPDNFTLQMQYSSDGGSNWNNIAITTGGSGNSQQFTKTTSISPTAQQYSVEITNEAEPAFFVAFADVRKGNTLSNYGSVDANGFTNITGTITNLAGTSSGTTYKFRTLVTTTDSGYNTVNKVTATAPRTLTITDTSGDGFYIDNGDGSQTVPTGDITSVSAGTNLNGGGTSGAVTLNLNSTISGDHTFSNNVVIQGNLDVQGTTTTIDTTNLDVKDKNITLNYGTGDTSANALGAGITIQDAVSQGNDATLTWNTTNDSFNFSHTVGITGDLLIQEAGGFPRITLQDLDGTNTRSFINHSGTDLSLTAQNNTANGRIVFQRYNGTTTLTSGYFDANGKLFASNSLDVTGNIGVTGTVDGRDIATDGTKLDGIEAGATTDQTQAEINALGITAIGLSGTPNITVGTISSGAITSSGAVVSGDNIVIGSGGTYQAGNIYSDSSWGMILRAKQNNPTQADFLFSDYADNHLVRFDGSYGLRIQTGGLQIGTTPVIDASRNLTNINSLAIGTASTTVDLDVKKSAGGSVVSRVWNSNTAGTGSAVFRLANSGNNADGSQLQFTDNSYYVGTITADRTNGMRFRVANASDPVASGNIRLTINPSGNATFAGTISSGAITSTGDLTLTADAYITNNTSDGSDNGSINISGGGAFGDTRGASLGLAGNENGNGGMVQIRAGQGSYSQIRMYSGGTERVRMDNGGLNILSGTLEVGSTTVIDSSRNLTNIGTIASGAITSSGVIAAGAVARMYTSSDRGYFVAGTNDSSNQHLYLGSYHGTTLKELTFSGSNNAFYPQTSEAIDLGLSTKKFKNLQLSGTISSGAITATALTIDSTSSTHNLFLQTRDDFLNTTNDVAIWITSGAVGGFKSGAGAHLVFEGRQSTRNFYFKLGNVTAPQHIMHSNGYVGIGTGDVTPTATLQVGGTISSGAITSTGDLLLDSANAEINLKSGGLGTNGAVNWTFNTTGTNYASIQLPYDTRATTGLHIDSGYPITIDATTRIDFDISGSTQMVLDTNGLKVNNYYYLDNKIMAQGTDSYLRINQSNQFSNGVWFGDSNIYSGTGKYIAAGSNGSTTNSRVYMYGGTYNGANVIALDGTDGKIKGSYYTVGANTVIDASRNITAGTISSGAITTPAVYLNDTNTSLTEGSGNALKITTPTGSIDIGSMNGSWVHIQATKNIYILPTSYVSIDGDLYPYTTAGNRNLGGTGNLWNHVYSNGYFIGSNEVIDASRNLTSIGTISSGAITAVSAIGAADNVRTGLTHDDSTTMAAGVGGQLVLGYKYTSAGAYTEGAILKMYKENGTSGHYGSGLKFQVRNHEADLSTKMTLDPSGNLAVTGTISSGAITSSGTLIANQLRAGDGTDGYFYSDIAGRTAFNGGQFYIQDGVNTYYNYSPNQYHGNTTGTTHYYRSNALSGTNWGVDTSGNISGLSYKVGTTTVIDASRNITAPSLNSTGTITINSTGNNPTVTLNRYSGQPNLKAGTDDGGYLIMDSSGGYLGLNWYSSDNIVIGLGGGNTGIGIIPSGYKLHVNGAIGSGAITSSGAVTAVSYGAPSGTTALYYGYNGREMVTGVDGAAYYHGSDGGGYGIVIQGGHPICRSLKIGTVNAGTTVIDTNRRLSNYKNLGMGEHKYSAVSLTAGNWYQIASGAGRQSGTFTLQDAISGGPHGSMKFYAGCSYGDGGSNHLKLIHNSVYVATGVTDVRIRDAGTYDTMYVDVYINRTGTYYISLEDTHYATDGWALITPSANPSTSGFGITPIYDIENKLVAEANNGAEKFSLTKSGNATFAGNIIKSGGTDAQFLKADGSVQSSSASSPQGTTSPFNATNNTLTFLLNVAHNDGLVTGSQTGVLDLSTGELEINSQGEINIKANSIEASKIQANTITGDEINTDLLNVKSFDNVSSTIKSHITAGTKFPLARDGQAYVQRTGTYTGSNASFVPVTITEVRDNAGYVAIFSGVLGDVSGGRVQYSLNNSTWVNASGNTNISWSAGTYRGYTYVYTGQITTLSTSQSTVYWRVYFSGSYNHTQLSLNVMMDNTR